MLGGENFQASKVYLDTVRQLKYWSGQFKEGDFGVMNLTLSTQRFHRNPGISHISGSRSIFYGGALSYPLS